MCKYAEVKKITLLIPRTHGCPTASLRDCPSSSRCKCKKICRDISSMLLFVCTLMQGLPKVTLKCMQNVCKYMQISQISLSVEIRFRIRRRRISSSTVFPRFSIHFHIPSANRRFFLNFCMRSNTEMLVLPSWLRSSRSGLTILNDYDYDYDFNVGM